MPEVDRREFLKIVGIGAGAAAATACSDPVEKVIPYLNQPEEIIPGIPTFYASTCGECPAACSIQVKTREGRPIKVDGNPEDPIANGSLCVRGQAGLYRTYDPTRFKSPMRRNGDALEAISWDEGLKLLAEKIGEAKGGVHFLGGQQTGTLDKLIDQFMSGIGSPNRVRFELFAHEALRTANEAVFGTSKVPSYELGDADVIVSFGADFLETWLNPLQNQVGYAKSRAEGHGYSVYVGPRLGLTGGNADLWLAPKPGTEIFIALGLAHEVAKMKGESAVAGYDATTVAKLTGVDAGKILKVAVRIANAHAPVALPPGNELQGTNATAFTAAVQMLNNVSGAIGKTVDFSATHQVGSLNRFRDLKQLAGQIRGGEVGVLLVHGVNPVYAVPALDFGSALTQDGLFTVSFSSANDETTAFADLILPDHTPFESWGDAEPIAGVRRLQQPTVRPLYDTRALGDVLLETGKAVGAAGLPAGSFKDVLKSNWSGGFNQALAKGGTVNQAARAGASAQDINMDFQPAQIGGEGDLALIVYPSVRFYDGRSARIPMLQELPDVVSKSMWTSVAELHPKTAVAKGLDTGDIVRVKTEAGFIEVPVMLNQTLREDIVAIEAGQGHQPVDPDAPDPDFWQQRATIGVNALSLLPWRLDSKSGGLAWLSTKAELEPTGQHKQLALAQYGFDQQGRGFAQATAGAAAGHAAHGGHADAPKEHSAYGDPLHLVTKEFDPADDSHPESPYRWGMTIDLDACTGCNACVTACNVENNIPSVGENNARVGREMQWVRIERYIEEEHGVLEVRHSPMLCQHCGAAPCENVCPVLATYHNGEGLNVMVPNRCIGTRYCSNNCSYKVRRFNHFPYDALLREHEGLMLNPDVTVRGKGVMEKCTFCIQRISGAKDQARAEGREVRDGEVVSACQQACPSNAITFGNLKDPKSRVSAKYRGERAYVALDHLYTRPAVGYLKKIKRS